mgnify:CR=1 FL=1
MLEFRVLQFNKLLILINRAIKFLNNTTNNNTNKKPNFHCPIKQKANVRRFVHS